jgi:TolA-binding protein
MTQHQSSITNVFAISPFDEYYLPSVNKLTFEKIDSTSLYNDKFKDTDLLQDNTLHIFVGMDSGLLANYVLEKSRPIGAKYLFVELDEVCELLTFDIPSESQKNFSICAASEFEDCLSKSDFNLFIVKQRFKMHYSSAASSNSHDDYTKLCHLVEKNIQNAHFDGTTAFTQKTFVQQQLNNVSENLLPAQLLKNTFKGKTCVVLGGGPSLDEHIEWINTNRQNLVVFSVSRIAGKLAKLGIISDIIVTVDPQDHSFEVNEAMMFLSHQSLLICAHHACSDIVAQWNGSLLFTGAQLPWQANETNIETIGPTVTNTAIHIAEEMGFSQILLCGVDLCHSKAGATHTVNTYTASLLNTLGNMYEWVETYNNEVAETPIQLLHAIEALAEAAALRPDITYTNLSINAAKVNGINYQHKDSIVLETIEPTQKHLLSPSHFTLSPEQKAIKLTQTNIQIEDAITDFNIIIDEVNSALTICKKMHTANSSSISNLAKKLDNIESKLNTKYPNICYLIKFYGFYEFSHFLTTQNIDNWTQNDINIHHNIYYQAYHDIASELRSMLITANKRLQSRIAEHKTPISFSDFVPQWIEDKHYGRAEIWVKEHPNEATQMTQADLSCIEQLKKNYQDLFKHTSTKVVHGDHATNINNAFKKLNNLFKHRHVQGITKMLEYVEPFSTQEPSLTKFYHLAKSYELFLHNKAEASLTEILKISDDMLLENEYQHIIMLSLNLNKLDVSLQYLEKIVHFNDAYLPQYAQVMSIQGQYQTALNLYLNYLDKYPNDIPVLIKLGTFLLNVEEFESAENVFKQVLQLEPNNQTALRYINNMSQHQ